MLLRAATIGEMKRGFRTMDDALDAGSIFGLNRLKWDRRGLMACQRKELLGCNCQMGERMLLVETDGRENGGFVFFAEN